MTMVAPRVGAWIENSIASGRRSGRKVAPRVGAWIEKQMELRPEGMGYRRAPRGRVD